MKRSPVAVPLLAALVAAAIWILGSGPDDTIRDTTPDLTREAGGPALALEAERPGGRADPPAAETERSIGAPAAGPNRGIRVYGSLTDDGGRPIEGEELALRSWDGNELNSFMFMLGGTAALGGEKKTRTAADGTFEFWVRAGYSGRVRLTGKQWVLPEPASFARSLADVDLGRLACTKAATLSGRVHENGQPIAGVKVNVNAHGRLPFHSRARTDANGAFEVAGVPPGTCRVFCVSGRHLSKRESFEVAAGEHKRVDIALEPGESLSGRVVDDLGRPIEGASVTASGRDSSGRAVAFVNASTKTDRSGFFTLAGTAGDALNVSANAPGHAAGSASKVSPKEGLVTITLQRLGGVSGMLSAEDGTPLAGSTIQLQRDGRGNTWGALSFGGSYGLSFGGRTVKTGDEGRFVFENVAPGTVQLVATGRHLEATERGIVVRPGERTRDVRMRASRGGVLDVTVHDPGGRPVAGARVVARPVGARKKGKAAAGAHLVVHGRGGEVAPVLLGSTPRGTETDAAGRAHLWGLEPAAMRVHVDHSDWVPVVSDIIRVPATGAVSVALSVGRGGYVEISTADASGRPAGHTSFRIAGEESQRSGKTDASGRARIGPFAPGRYRASIEATRRGSAGAFVLDVGLFAGSLSRRTFAGTETPVDVRAGETSPVRLTLPVLATVAGTVRDAGGPVASASVSLHATGGSSDTLNARTGTDGSFTIEDVEPGTYDVRYHHGNSPFPHEARLTVSPGSTTEVLQLVITGHELTVQVEAAGRPIAGANVRLDQPAGPNRRSTGRRTDETGAVRFPGLPAGTYRVRVDHAGHAARSVPDVRLDGRKIVRVPLIPAGGLAIRVEHSLADVQRFDFRYRKAGTSGWNQNRRRKPSLTVDRLEPGSWEVQARLQAGDRWTEWCNARAVEIATGDPTPVTLAIR